MSVEIWPSLPPEQLITAIDQTQTRELQWLLNELHDTLQSLKHGLEDCYALLAPVDPGSTLVVSTHRNETVKGHITRVGTRIVKGTLTLKMKTQPHQTYTINPDNPIQLAPLVHLHALLTESIDLLTLTMQYTYTPPTSTSPSPSTSTTPSPPPSPTRSTATFIAAQLRLLSQSLAESSSLLRGPQPLTASDATWVSKSCSPDHFLPAHSRPGPNLSLHWGVQESQLVLWLRALEPAAAPVNLGLKLALAIGTARRLEHDEAEQIFMYTYPEGAVPPPETAAGTAADGSQQKGSGGSNSGRAENEAQVFVREKVRVESADPALMSLGTKLTALATTLSLARGNLAVVMGEDPEW
ncbi:hypothetical protein VPNG_04512 [Cytospora leucostoma]|uniref:RAVE subunit 2/Rogdi n=1 Tax=Cytospora leucostoma TaxID=1230097 RepID=A0A423XCK9_9PEZI|nr:hypothetical protein VPNG_04512 [Cytospora leucostoma]